MNKYIYYIPTPTGRFTKSSPMGLVRTPVEGIKFEGFRRENIWGPFDTLTYEYMNGVRDIEEITPEEAMTIIKKWIPSITDEELAKLVE